MNKPNWRLAPKTATTAAALALAATVAHAATTFTWTGESDANGNASSLNWNDGTGGGKAWVDNASSPNNAAFPASSSRKTISVSGTRIVNDVTINGSGYTLNNGSSGLLKVGGKVSANQSFSMAAGFAAPSVRLGGNSQITLWAVHSTHTTTYLEGGLTLAVGQDRCFGPVPGSATDNIVVLSGNPAIYANRTADHAFSANRTIRLRSGAGIRFGGGSGGTYTYNGVIAGTPDATLGFVTNNVVTVPNTWVGKISFNPGASRTNDLGRLTVGGVLKISGGTTRVGSSADFQTTTAAPLYVYGNGSGYGDTKGKLVVDGGTLYCSQANRYIDVHGFGQVTVGNGGKIYMPSAEWLNGLNSPGKLTITDGGEVTVNILRLSQSATAGSEIRLDEGGFLAASRLGLYPANGYACRFVFNGGRLQSRSGSESFLGSTTGTALTDENWSSVVFSVEAGGAVFDTSNGKDIWWTRPLASGAASDGGVRKTGSGKLVLTKANAYNGATVVAGGAVEARADNAIPAGTTLRLVGGCTMYANAKGSASPAGSDTAQNLGRLEGSGKVLRASAVTVNGSIAPDADGTIEIGSACTLSGNYEIRGNANGCGCLKVATDQNLSGLVLKAADMAAMDGKATRGTYKILDAPGGYLGHFGTAADFPLDKWRIRETGTAIYLEPVNGMVILFR